MQLTEDERAALERWRANTYIRAEGRILGQQARMCDAIKLADTLARLFPVRTYGDIVIRWDDDITPERLVACGFILSDFCVAYYGLAFYPLEVRWWSDGAVIPIGVTSRSMLDVWQLMERCGIEEGGK